MRKPQSQPNMFANLVCTDTHPYIRGTTESICIYLFLKCTRVLLLSSQRFKNTYDILLRMYSTKVHTTIAKKSGNPGDLMRAGEKSGSTFPSQPTVCTSPKYSFPRKKIPRRRHLACCMHTYCRSRKACLIQTRYVQVEPCTCMYMHKYK